MQYDLGFTGLALLLALSLGFGVIAQLLGRRTTHWEWLIAAVGFFIGGFVASEILWADPSLDLEPVIDGLSVDEALFGGLIGGLIADISTRIVTGGSPFHKRTPV